MNWIELILFLIAVSLPVAVLVFYSRIPPMGTPDNVVRFANINIPDSTVGFSKEQTGPKSMTGQRYTSVSVLPVGSEFDIVVGDARLAQVTGINRRDNGEWASTVLGENLATPASVVSIDLDSDGDQDFVVSCSGSIESSDHRIGRVVWLENENGEFTTRTILRRVRRAADAQCGDFDSDGDIDIVVAIVGGQIQGEILILENNGEQEFTDYQVMSIPGTLNVPVKDFDGDGDLDFAAVVSGEDQQVWVFENDGKRFDSSRKHLAFSSINFDLGLTSMIAVDVDKDGDQDLVATKGGHKFSTFKEYPKPWHGVQLLENKGDWKFEMKEISNVSGATDIASADLDGDGDIDFAIVSRLNDWMVETAGSVYWLENDGEQAFKTWKIADDPIQVGSVDCGDFDGNGSVDIVIGCVHPIAPFERFGGVEVLLNENESGPKNKDENEPPKSAASNNAKTQSSLLPKFSSAKSKLANEDSIYSIANATRAITGAKQ
ncbi:MAG: FG-GAP repeat domain-containing protein [Mariniblastus sp.]